MSRSSPPTQPAKELPADFVKNIKLLLKRKPKGYDILPLTQLYFLEYRSYFFPKKVGLKTWKQIFEHEDCASFCELYNSGNSVRLKESEPGASGQNENGQKTSTSATANTANATLPGNSLKRSSSSMASSNNSKESSSKRGPAEKARQTVEDVDLESCSDATSVTDVTHVSISPYNRTRLLREQNSIRWIPRESGLTPLTFSNLILERGLGPDVPDMFIDCTYCERQVLEHLMDVKGHIKMISAEKFAAIRNKYNEFEFERGAIFQHGAAIKLANIDVLLNHGLTNPKDTDGSNLVGPNELLYFVDLYGGPGGCVEYVLWKKKWEAKGFGISPRGKMDYNLIQAEHFPRESFEPFYGETGTEGNGDISKPYNMAKFSTFVRESTNGAGAHFLIASGGDRNDYVDEDQKELRCKYIFMSEFLCALQVLRKGGHFVCRMYDMYTPFTVGLLYLMFRTFEQVAILKPESSLPASSEKYVVCKWRKSEFHVREITNYLSECHKVDWLTKRNMRGNDGPADIIHLVSRERIRESYGFCQYILDTNHELGQRQYLETRSLIRKIQSHDESSYVSERLREIQMKCVDLWGIPKTTRQKPKYSTATSADIRAQKLVRPYSFDFFINCELSGEGELTLGSLIEEINRPKEWQFMPVGRTRGFFLCLGGSSVYQFGGAKWTEVSEKIELMNNTLVYADLVDEIKMNGSNQTISTGFHIIDALILGGSDIRQIPTNERYDLICKYAKSMNKISRSDLVTIRAKQQYEMKYFNKMMDKVQESERVRTREGESGAKYLAPVSLHQDEGLLYCPAGILFVKTFKENFAPADARFCMMNRQLWRWTPLSDLKVPLDLTTKVEVDDEMMDEKSPLCTTSILKHFTASGL